MNILEIEFPLKIEAKTSKINDKTIKKFLHFKNKTLMSKIILYCSYFSVMIFVGYLMTLVN